MSSRPVALLLAVALAGAGRAARADGAAPAAPLAPPALSPPGATWQTAAAPEVQLRWYRGSMVLADLAASAVVAAGLAQRNAKLGDVVPGAIALATFAPGVHLLHGNGTGAVESVALRLGLPAAGAFLAWTGFHCRAPQECYDGTNDAEYELLGAMAGLAVAMILDDGWLAHEQRREPDAWTPVVAPASRGGGATFGIAGAF